ncbi:MAG: diaminopimelate decarboxylase, partial [Bacteroidota bacterium]
MYGNNIKTPYYQYDLDRLRQTLIAAGNAASARGYHLHYAIKANNNPTITNFISNMGMGADCVSGNEVSEALLRGFPAQKVVYAGVGKSDQEIAFAIEKGILCLNCESLEELKVTEEIACSLQKAAPVAIRVNPSVEANTHHYITTGLEENKFGVHLSQLQEVLDYASASRWIQLKGLHFHIGSQITGMEPFRQLSIKASHLWRTMEMDRRGANMLNLGGGLGVNYENPETNPMPDFEEYFDVFSKNLSVPDHVQIHFEPGRSLVAQCGQLITQVLYTKKGVNREFVITDAGMTELMRPSLYQSRHLITNLTSHGPMQKYDVVGPICESSDVFGKDLMLPEAKRGDLLAI